MRRQAVVFILCVVLFPFSSLKAQEMILPKLGTMLSVTPAFSPVVLKGLTIDPKDPFKFDFIINRGDTSLTSKQKQVEYTKLINYFLAALAVPDDQQWVNLSPYEKSRIIPDTFGQTQMGNDLLAQDYILKQLSASLLYPDSVTGKEFWAKVYAQAGESKNDRINTFNKVWIVPDKATVYEKGNTVYVLENHLKVMTEEDYLATNIHGVEAALRGRPSQGDQQNLPILPPLQVGNRQARIMNDIVVPELIKEVNHGKNFALLRQVYSAMLLATWYKRTLKDSILSRIYANQGKVKGIDQPACRQSGTICVNNQLIYEQYLQAFKKGVFNMIKEELTSSGQLIPRKYFSGGTEGYASASIVRAVQIDPAQAAEFSMKDDIASVSLRTVDDSMQSTKRTSLADRIRSGSDARLRRIFLGIRPRRGKPIQVQNAVEPPFVKPKDRTVMVSIGDEFNGNKAINAEKVLEILEAFKFQLLVEEGTVDIARFHKADKRIGRKKLVDLIAMGIVDELEGGRVRLNRKHGPITMAMFMTGEEQNDEYRKLWFELRESQHVERMEKLGLDFSTDDETIAQAIATAASQAIKFTVSRREGHKAFDLGYEHDEKDALVLWIQRFELKMYQQMFFGEMVHNLHELDAVEDDHGRKWFVLLNGIKGDDQKQLLRRLIVEHIVPALELGEHPMVKNSLQLFRFNGNQLETSQDIRRDIDLLSSQSRDFKSMKIAVARSGIKLRESAEFVSEELIEFGASQVESMRQIDDLIVRFEKGVDTAFVGYEGSGIVFKSLVRPRGEYGVITPRYYESFTYFDPLLKKKVPLKPWVKFVSDMKLTGKVIQSLNGNIVFDNTISEANVERVLGVLGHMPYWQMLQPFLEPKYNAQLSDHLYTLIAKKMGLLYTKHIEYYKKDKYFDYKEHYWMEVPFTVDPQEFQRKLLKVLINLKDSLIKVMSKATLLKGDDVFEVLADLKKVPTVIAKGIIKTMLKEMEQGRPVLFRQVPDEVKASEGNDVFLLQYLYSEKADILLKLINSNWESIKKDYDVKDPKVFLDYVKIVLENTVLPGGKIKDPLKPEIKATPTGEVTVPPIGDSEILIEHKTASVDRAMTDQDRNEDAKAYVSIFPDPSLSVMNFEVFQYYQAIRKAINPDRKKLKVLYGGAGADLTNVLISTGSDNIFMASNYKFVNPMSAASFREHLQLNWDRRPTQENAREIYRSWKLERGYSHVNLVDKDRDIFYEALITELISLGIKLGDFEVKVIRGGFSITINKSFPSLGVDNIVFSFINVVDITKPSQYVPELQSILYAGFDVYFQNAGVYMAQDYQYFMPSIANALDDGGFLITDDHYIDFDDGIAKASIESSLRAFDLKLIHLSTDMELWAYQQGLKKTGGYGIGKSLLQKVAKKGKDRAMSVQYLGQQQIFKKGGIDMNPSELELMIKRDGQGVVLPISQQDFSGINIRGLVPVILSIKPASTVQLFH